MPRTARLRLDTSEGWYHLYCRTVGGKKDDFPLTITRESAEIFIAYLKHFANAYYCEISAFCVMGNHYHLVMRFDEPKKRKRSDLRDRAALLYPNTFEQTKIWDADKWKQFSVRLHDVSEFMRNLNMAYARWYNKTFERRGRFWAERFQSTLLYGPESLLDCMQYVDLNPVRADLVGRPEDWVYSSMYARYHGDASWLKSLDEIDGLQSEAMSAEKVYKELVYLRGEIPSKTGQAAIESELVQVLLKPQSCSSFKLSKRVRHFARGLVVGPAEVVESWLHRFLNTGRYRRRKNIMPQYGGSCFSLR